MKKMATLLFAGLLALPVFSVCREGKEKKAPHVLFITGGHEYDESAFDQLLAKLPITYDHVKHPDAHAALKAERIAPYDVILLYDMPKEISEEAQGDFIAALANGKGLVALHHAFCSYDFWPEYVSIIGGRYHHYPWKENGAEKQPSTYKHGVTFDVKVADRNHPITKGIEDFSITDETYGGAELLPTVHPLLSTDEPTHLPLVCWTNEYRNARVTTLTLGHDRLAWENPSFIKILSQALCWAAGL
ncbi:MAG: ThuA domain-containing protein [Tannerellaceae bacterium]|jgi:type 1 glutamine amidotransferase|nr:ThuA domain-containing protein [Tannerellaceae bacterium]